MCRGGGIKAVAASERHLERSSVDQMYFWPEQDLSRCVGPADVAAGNFRYPADLLRPSWAFQGVCHVTVQEHASKEEET